MAVWAFRRKDGNLPDREPERVRVRESQKDRERERETDRETVRQRGGENLPDARDSFV